MNEFSVFFENGVWLVLQRDEFGNVRSREVAPSLEQAIQAVSLLTGDMVGIKLITKEGP